MEFKYAANTKYLIMALIGIIMSCLGYLVYVFSPLDLIVDSMSTLRPGTTLFGMWEQPPMEILCRTYIYNVTNPKAFLAGKEKLRVEQLGPYVYQEVLRNTEGVLNENGTMTYKPTREYVFRRELSVGDPEIDTAIVPNIPLLGMGSYLSSFNIFIRIGFNAMSADAEQFLNITVKEYLWGYEDKLVTLASKYVPTWIDFPVFGIMDRLIAMDQGNTVTIYLKESKDKSNNRILPYSISKFNGLPGLKEWNYEEVGANETSEANTRCNTITGSYDGGLFARHFPENATLTLYRRAFCRPVTFDYENRTVNDDGFEVYNYRVSKNFLASGDDYPDNKCYCVAGKCLPKGFSSLSPCYYGIPIAISQPHFYNADETVTKQIDGLNPDIEKHDSTAQINPNMGLPLSAHLRIQVNLHVSESSMSKVKQFSNLILPLCWFELNIDEPPAFVKQLLRIVLNVVPVLQKVLMWVLGIFGISLIAVAALIVFYFPPERRLEDPYGHRIGYSPILVIPLSSRLKDARIS